MAGLAPNFVFLVGGQNRQNQGMIFADTGCSNESLVESEIGFAVVIQVERDSVVEGDDFVRRGIHELGPGGLGHGEDSDSGRAGCECVGVEPLLEWGRKDEVLPGRTFHRTSYDWLIIRPLGSRVNSAISQVFCQAI